MVTGECSFYAQWEMGAGFVTEGGRGGGILGKFRYSQNRGALSSQLRGKLVIESVLRNPEEAVLTIEH